MRTAKPFHHFLSGTFPLRGDFAVALVMLLLLI